MLPQLEQFLQGSLFCSLRINFCSRVDAWAVRAFASPSSKGEVHLDVSLGLDGWHCCCQMSTSFTDYPATNDALSLRDTWVDSSSVSYESSLCSSTEWRSTLIRRSFWNFRAASSTEGLWCAGQKAEKSVRDWKIAAKLQILGGMLKTWHLLRSLIWYKIL